MGRIWHQSDARMVSDCSNGTGLAQAQLVSHPHMRTLMFFEMKYLLRDGLEIGMSMGTCSNPQCFSLQYLINLILLLVRGESVAD